MIHFYTFIMIHKFIGIYILINTITLLMMKTEGDIFPSDMNRKGKLSFSFLIVVLGIPIMLVIGVALFSRPIYIKYRWKQRKKNIKIAKALEEKNSKPEHIIGIYP